jgi:uncharacterized protein (DUF2062 family)
MHARLLAGAMCPWRYRRGAARISWRGLVEWLNPARAWRQVRDGDFGRGELATGVAIGLFIANLPVYGVQTLLALYTARKLHLHPLPVVAGSQVSTPPVGPAMVAGAIWIGHVLLHGAIPSWSDMDASRVGVTKLIGPLLADWAVGSVVMGFAMAVAGFAATLALFRFVQADSATRA